MILTAHQPAYLPWLGYFDKIIRSDIYVYLDSVQYEVRSFINRNRFKTSQGEMYLTVPVKSHGHRGSTISELEIDNSMRWREKHLKAIFLNYKKALRFSECYPKLEALYKTEYRFLSGLCWDHLLFWLKELGVQRTVVRLSQLQIESKKSDLILELCGHFGADRYISGKLGKNYLKEEDFHENGITIDYQNYQHPVYPQLWGDFIPCMSIVDFWMNSNNYRLITGGTST